MGFSSRVALVLLVCVGLVGGLGCSGATRPEAHPVRSDATEHPWPMFRGSATHIGDYSSLAAPKWRVRWSKNTGARIDASPLVTADGRVIVADRAGGIVVLDLRTGRGIRRVSVGAGIWSSPALIGDTLITASSNGFVEARDARTLQRVWRKPVPARSLSGITVHRGVAYLCSGKTLLGFRAQDGARTMRVELAGRAFTAPAIAGSIGLLVVGDRAGHVYGVDTASNAIRWRATTAPGAHNDGSPVISGGLVLIGSNASALYAFRQEDGESAWRAASGGWVVSTPAVHRGIAYFGSDDDTLRAVRLRDGQEQWRSTVGGDLASSPTVVGSLVVHGAHDGKLHAHHLNGRRAHPPIDVGAPLYASIAVAPDGAFVAATHRGRVIVVE